MAYKYNIFTGQFDLVRSDSSIKTYVDGQWLRLDTSNDPLTGALDIEPYYAPSPASTDTYSLYCSKDIRVKAGQKVIYDY